jgi:predicted Na+-dependent transporter
MGRNQERRISLSIARQREGFIHCSTPDQVVEVPVVLTLLLPGVAVNPAKIAQSLVLLMLLPLGVGLALKSRYEEMAARVKPMLTGFPTSASSCWCC